MKAILLCAGMGTRLGDLTEDKPKCLIPFKGKTLLEYSIDNLKQNGITDIRVVTGYKADMIREVLPNDIITIENKDYNITQPPYSARLGLNCFEDERDNVFIIDGDLIFDKEIIEDILKNKFKSQIVSYYSKNINEAGSKIEITDGVVSKIGRYISPPFPFPIHAGITYISKIDYLEYKKLLNEDQFIKTEMHVLLNEFCKSNRLYAFNIDKEKINIKHSMKNLDGGSFSQVTRTNDDNVIKKECTKDTKRLINEIQFLINLPDELKPHFPEVIDYSMFDNKDHVWYTMPYYDLQSLKKLLLTGKINSKDACEFLYDLVCFMNENFYKKNQVEAKDNYVDSVHYYRIYARKKITEERAPVFKDIFKCDKIIINGLEYGNVLPIINNMISCESLTKKLTPPNLSLIHGDLHFDNVLVDYTKKPFGFKLVDPKGFSVGDKMYDMSKLIHNFNGLYDFIYEYMFDLKYEIENGTMHCNFNIHNCRALEEFKKINNYLLVDLDRIFRKDDPNWYFRAKFIEAINFCSLQPFHLIGDNKETKAIGMYLIGVKLLNDFWSMVDDDLKDSNRKHKIVNINTVEDYTYAQNLFKDKDKEQFPGV